MLASAFSLHGVISRMEIKSDKSGSSKYALIKYDNPAQAQRMKEIMHGGAFQGRVLKIEWKGDQQQWFVLFA